VKQVKTIILKPRTEEIAEAWVDLQYGYGIVGKGKMQLGMYSARSMSQDNTNKAVVSILTSNEEATETANFKACARQCSDKVNVHTVECSVSAALEIFYHTKDELGNSFELTTWLKATEESF
jgi:hypothetical protein